MLGHPVRPRCNKRRQLVANSFDWGNVFHWFAKGASEEIDAAGLMRLLHSMCRIDVLDIFHRRWSLGRFMEPEKLWVHIHVLWPDVVHTIRW